MIRLNDGTYETERRERGELPEWAEEVLTLHITPPEDDPTRRVPSYEGKWWNSNNPTFQDVDIFSALKFHRRFVSIVRIL